MSYNDCILEGVQNFKKEHPEVDVFISSPNTLEEVERIFTDWLKRPGSNIPVLFVLASSDYQQLVDDYEPVYPLTPNKSILLFESLKEYENEKIHTFHMSMYGASYLAGESAYLCTGNTNSLVVLGSSTDQPIESARDGFFAGLGTECDVECLADDWTGYIMPSATYRKMEEWASKYNFIFPVAGGSNAGIYRYSREFPNSPFLAGMDVDQSGYSNKITGSVVKRFDRLLNEYLAEWLKSGSMPHFNIYGLESGYVDWVLSPRYFDMLNGALEASRNEAIRMETDYYGKD